MANARRVPDLVPLWPPSPIEWAGMDRRERARWRALIGKLGTPEADGWLPGTLGWRPPNAEERAAWAELDR